MAAVLLQWTCNCIVLWKLYQKCKLTILQMLSENFVDTRKSLFFTIITLCIRFGLTCDTSQAWNIIASFFCNASLRKKCRYSELFWSAFSQIWTECGEIFRIQSKCGKMRTRITPNTDTFYAMLVKGIVQHYSE